MRGDRLDNDRPHALGRQRRGVAAQARCPFVGERRRQRGLERDAGARDDDYMGEIEELAPAAPARKAEKRVAADDQRKRALRRLAPKLLKRVDGIAPSLAL